MEVVVLIPCFSTLMSKVFKTGSSGFSPRLTGLQLAHQCQDNGLVQYWLEIVQETWICELSVAGK